MELFFQVQWVNFVGQGRVLFPRWGRLEFKRVPRQCSNYVSHHCQTYRHSYSAHLHYIRKTEFPQFVMTGVPALDCGGSVEMGVFSIGSLLCGELLGGEIGFVGARGSPLPVGDLTFVNCEAEAPPEHFLCFMRLFWNQIFTCLSVRLSCAASSARRSFVKKWLKWNSFSNSRSCFRVYAVLFLFPSVGRELHTLAGVTENNITKTVSLKFAED